MIELCIKIHKTRTVCVVGASERLSLHVVFNTISIDTPLHGTQYCNARPHLALQCVNPHLSLIVYCGMVAQLGTASVRERNIKPDSKKHGRDRVFL
jgi:hypothetical protein